MKGFLFCLLLLQPLKNLQDNDHSFERAKAIAHGIEGDLRECNARVVVGEFTENRKHPAWVKEAFGPPSDVEMDIKKNDSLLYPYLVVAEFTLWLHYSSDFASRDEAERGTTDKPLMKSRNRNIYLVGDEGIRLKSTEVLIGNWQERPRWGDACWDHLDTASAGGN